MTLLNQNNLFKYMALFLAVLVMSSCSSENKVNGKASQITSYKSCSESCDYGNEGQEKLHADVQKLPDGVLDGAGLVSLTAFETAPDVQTNYYAEIDGAVLSIKIEPKEGHYKLTRTYTEPEFVPAVKEYYPVHLKNGYLIGDNIIGWSVGGWHELSEGLILWEAQSGIESIPTDSSILYKAANK